MSNRGTGATREGDGYTAGKWISTESELPTRQQDDWHLKLCLSPGYCASCLVMLKCHWLEQ
ncbi:hypothetical protein [Nostoc sp. CCY0012]|uniref:hypothetical protein n=1 Tax=Nostoc sp. CCY0012 TaxID=1056123 RepID=UPI0039C6B0D8